MESPLPEFPPMRKQVRGMAEIGAESRRVKD